MADDYYPGDPGEQLLRHIWDLIGYWAGEGESNVPADTPARERLEGLAHSILTALDGMSAVLPPFAVVPLGESQGEVEGDIAGDLNDRFFPLSPRPRQPGR